MERDLTEIFLSIITINRNNSYGLPYTFESINRITNRSLEHIIIDGNSKDDSLQKIRQYVAKKQGIDKRFISENDEGIWDAMNKGARLARGRYVMFVNSGDEIYFLSKIELVLSYISAKSPIWLYGNATRINKLTRNIECRYQKANVTYSRFISGLDWIPHGSTIIRKDIFMLIDGYKDWSLISDQALFMKLWQFEAPHYLPQILTRFESGGVHESLKPFKRFLLWRKSRLASYEFGKLRIPNSIFGWNYLLSFLKALKSELSRILKNNE